MASASGNARQNAAFGGNTGNLYSVPKEPDDIVQTARVRAKAKKNLNTIVLGLQNYADKNKGRMPPPAVIDKNGKRLLSWRVLILPYIEHKDLYEQFHLDEPWDSEHNKKLLAKMPAVFASNPPGGKKSHETYYQALVGSGGSEGGREAAGGAVLARRGWRGRRRRQVLWRGHAPGEQGVRPVSLSHC